MIAPTYFLSFAHTETVEVGVIEFDTYSEAYEEYQRREMSGYSVVIRDIDPSSDLANEIRKAPTYEDRTEDQYSKYIK